MIASQRWLTTYLAVGKSVALSSGSDVPRSSTSFCRGSPSQGSMVANANVKATFVAISEDKQGKQREHGDKQGKT